jgi:hypothetical protein
MSLLRGLWSRIAGGTGGSDHCWEYYGRIRFVSEGIRALPLNRPRVLDVGGATGNNLLRRFGIRDVTTLDLEPSADIVASADEIPAEDGAFDVATCIDTLEHVPPPIRRKVVSELIRVASRAVFLVAPVDSPENNRAEELVLRYVRDRFLDEHREHGLVDFDDLEEHVAEEIGAGRAVRCERAEIDDLLNWVVSMTRGRVSLDRIYAEAYFLENRFCPRRVVLAVFKD